MGRSWAAGPTQLLPAEKDTLSRATTVPNDSYDATQIERDRVFAWRLEELLRAGYRPEAASLLAAHPEVDLHRAIELRARGCAHETAVRILA